MTSTDFSKLMGSLNSPLIVVTTAADEVLAGCLVGYHSQSSITPQHYGLWLSKANHTYRVGLLASHFGAHFLTQEDVSLAKHFGTQSGQTVDKFAHIGVETDEHGVPLLTDCPNRAVLERIAVLDDGGDHVCITTRVTSAQSNGKFSPLRIVDIGQLDPAHGSDERIIDP